MDNGRDSEGEVTMILDMTLSEHDKSRKDGDPTHEKADISKTESSELC